MTKAVGRWVHYGILLTLALAPTQIGFEVLPKVHLSPVDPVLGITALLGLWCAWQRRLDQRIHAPSPFALLFLFFGVVSLTAAQNRMAALKDVTQWVLYFLVAWMLFRYGLEEIKTRRLGFGLVVAVTLLILGIATIQFFRSGVPDLGVRGLFGNRNVLGGFLALALPFAFAQTLTGDNPLAGLAGALVSLVGIAVILSGAVALAIGIALLAMAATQGRFATALTLAFILLVVVVIHPNLPRRGELSDPWLDSIELHDPDGQVSRRYPDWECAWLMMRENPWRGVGAGNYQERVSSYRRIPTPPGAPEPDTQNLYLVLGSTIGLPGLLVFVAMLLEGMALALRTTLASARAGEGERAMALGAFGALLAFSVAAIWHPLLVRGIGIPLVAVLALSHHLHARAS